MLQEPEVIAEKIQQLYDGKAFIQPAARAGLACRLPVDVAVVFMIKFHAIVFDEFFDFDDLVSMPGINTRRIEHFKILLAVEDVMEALAGSEINDRYDEIYCSMMP